MKATKCRRCGGSEQKRLAGFMNHLNGDTHCYGCGGTGVRIQYTAEEKAQITAEDQWTADAHSALVGGYYSYVNAIRGACIGEPGAQFALGGTPCGPIAKRLSFWVGEAMFDAAGEVKQARLAREAELRREFIALRDAA